jgi:hypothetical protein
MIFDLIFFVLPGRSLFFVRGHTMPRFSKNFVGSSGGTHRGIASLPNLSRDASEVLAEDAAHLRFRILARHQ